ncbi:hypothetical protein BHM03_00023509, partial [Ensete ventricosum]
MGSTYRSDKISVHGPPAIGRYRKSPRGDEATPRLPTWGRSAASSSSERTRHRIVFQQKNEASFSHEVSGMHCVYRSVPGTVLYQEKFGMPVRT